MAAPALTTLARVKAWLGITDDSSDAQLLGLIQAASAFIYKLISLPTVVVSQYSELRDSQGHYWIRPYVWPFISLQSILYCGNSITQLATGNPINSGYQVTRPNQGMGPARLTVVGYPSFPYGKDVLTINYTAGFQQVDECVVIPVSTGEPPAVTSGTVILSQLWAADGGVTLTMGGQALEKVTSNPLTGQYAVADGIYVFNATEVGVAVTITYSYVPADLAQAVTELVGSTLREADHIGVKSKTLGGQETVSYFQNQITPAMKMVLGPYMAVSPR